MSDISNTLNSDIGCFGYMMSDCVEYTGYTEFRIEILRVLWVHDIEHIVHVEFRKKKILSVLGVHDTEYIECIQSCTRIP